MDNCEHVAGAVRSLCTGLLASCPRLSIVATSREPLGLENERVWFLTPLDETAAVELFVARAARAVGHARATALDHAGIAAVCARVEHLPLAVELAAGRLRSLGLVELDTFMDDQMSLLVDRRRLGDHRHQTMRATIEWSCRELDETGQSVFGALSAFRGGGTIDALSELVPGLDEFELLDNVEELVSRSLACADDGPDGRTRYRLLEPIRQFAESSIAADTRSELADRHARWVLRRVPMIATELLSRPGARGELGAEAPNAAAAIHHLVRTGEVSSALRLVGSLGYFWFSDRPTEGWSLTELSLDASSDQQPARSRAAALVTAGQLLQQQLRLDESRTALMEAVELYSDSETPRLGWALFQLGRTHAIAERDVEARLWFDEAARVFEVTGDELGLAWARHWQAELTYSQPEMRRLAESLVEFAREKGLLHPLASTLVNLLAKADFLAERPQSALGHIDEAIAIYRSFGDEWQLADAMIGATSLALTFEQPEAWELLVETTALISNERHETHRRHYLGIAAEGLRRRGEGEVAAALAWAVDDRWRPPYEDFNIWIHNCRAC